MNYLVSRIPWIYFSASGKIINKLLTDRGYSLRQYDQFFCYQPEVLTGKYGFIVCSEVIEHFMEPAKEFKLLKGLLKPGGKLFCMTERYAPEIDFPGWYYKHDPTHEIRERLAVFLSLVYSLHHHPDLAGNYFRYRDRLQNRSERGVGPRGAIFR